MNTPTRSRLLFGLAAAISLVFSIALWFGGNKDQGVFVGLWVPSILALGAFVAATRPNKEVA